MTANESSYDALEKRLRGHLALQVSHPHFSIIANDCYAAADAIEKHEYLAQKFMAEIATLQAEKDDARYVAERAATQLDKKKEELTALQEELADEKLKRQQAEHERDSELEALAGSQREQAGLRELLQQCRDSAVDMTGYGELASAIDAFLSRGAG